MNMKEAVAKAAKLLKLAQSDNANEAALAAAKAQEIIDRYKLSGMDLSLDASKKEEDEEDVREFEAPLDDEGNVRPQIWRGRLAVIIAEHNQCKTYAMGGAIRLVGRASDAEAVRYLFAYLSKEVNRLANRDAYGNGRAWASNFRLGCIQTIAEKLKEQRAATVQAVKDENPSAIVLVQNSLARLERRQHDAEEEMRRSAAAQGMKIESRIQRTKLVVDAREQGRKAAQEIKLSAKTGLGAGNKTLTGGA